MRQFLGMLLLFIGPCYAQAQEVCMSSLKQALNSQAAAAKALDNVAHEAGTLLKRTLTPTQQKALTQARQVSPHEVYTANELAQQTRILKKAGFKKEEIDLMRQKNILTNSVLKLPQGAPVGVEFKSLALKNMEAKDLKSLNGGKSMNYVVGQDGRMYVTRDAVDFPKDKVMTVSHSSSQELASNSAFVIREAGEVSFDSQNKSYIFKPQYGIDTSSIEVNELLSRVKDIAPRGATVSYKTNKSIPQSQVVKCLDVLSAQSSGKNFVLDRMISDNLVTTTAIIGTELMGADRLGSAQGRAVLASDIIGGNVTGYIGAKIGKRLIVKDSNFVTSMAVRTGMGMSMIEVQKYITKGTLATAVPSAETEPTAEGEDPPPDTAEAIAAFNRTHFFARLPVNHYLDKFMVKTLPNMVFNTCQKKPGLSVLVSPRSIRIYERYASSVIYYGLRGSIVGQ